MDSSYFLYLISFCVFVSDSELNELPKMYHLDDYERCLDHKKGIYCLGQFEFYSDVEDNPKFAIIQVGV